ncbi:DeoR/GlpR family DNA-binding transcription regulator [Vaginisenegalia massiliensis]|uniref:DeoR/GlpR family DNA-binding transcription regulator n=1 Tax=Vaginisenegalia massiliensis TaxID=2058294 RepID=UPI000F53A714|nr:DeoR/GlpR family DNA-binding transcription regulator [Vaginisenegalia massiliensis]
MNKDQRQETIKDLVKETGKISVNDLANRLAVTPETIRRDLDELEQVNEITRIHGAAIPYSPSEVEMAFNKKMVVNQQAKKDIARQAAMMIKSGDTVAVDIGTTTMHIGNYVDRLTGVTVITNSLAAAQTFNNAIEEGRMAGQVIVLPGVTNPMQASIKGSYTINFLKKFHFDKTFISCGGLLEQAVYDFDMEESLVSSTMIECSDEAILLVDKSKLHQRTLFEVAGMNQVNAVICDADCPDGWRTYGYSWYRV